MSWFSDAYEDVTGTSPDNTVKSVANSDVGRAAGAGLAPLTAARDATVALTQGDLKKAAGAATGISTGGNPLFQSINASDSVRDLFNTKEANNLTLGLSGDSVRANDSYKSLQNAELTSAGFKDIIVFSAKGAALATGAAYAGEAGYLSKAATYASEKPVEALLLGKLAADKGFGAIAEKYLPGVSSLPDYFSGKEPQPEYGSTPGTNPLIDSYTVGPIDLKTKIVLAIAAILVLFVFLKKR